MIFALIRMSEVVWWVACLLDEVHKSHFGNRWSRKPEAGSDWNLNFITPNESKPKRVTKPGYDSTNVEKCSHGYKDIVINYCIKSHSWL